MDGEYLPPFPSRKRSEVTFIIMLSTAALEGAQTRILGFTLAAALIARIAS